MTVAALPASPACLSDTRADAPGLFSSTRIRTLIVDDQLLEREVMRRLLKSESDIEIVGTSSNGKEAVEAIQRLKPDLVFLDVQMPELDGFGVVSTIPSHELPVVIFVTANEEFARKAFDVQALDYLIKPCERSRLRVALQRARDEISRKRSEVLQQKFSELLLKDIKATARHPERLVVRSAGKILFLSFEDIHWIEATDDQVHLHTGTAGYTTSDSITSLEAKLPADRFLRINRSTLVNLAQIREMQPLTQGEYAVVLENGTQLTLTRNYRGKLQQLGL